MSHERLGTIIETNKTRRGTRSVAHARQNKEIAAADGLNVLFQRFAVGAASARSGAFFRIVLIADGQQAHIKLASIGRAERIAVSPTHHIRLDCVSLVRADWQDECGCPARWYRHLGSLA